MMMTILKLVPKMWILFTLLCTLIMHTIVVTSEPGSSQDLDFYSYFAVDIFDNIVAFEKYRGKVSLVVNVASECGYTDGHYKALQLLQKMFKDTGHFNVLAFPCNQFGAQEPGNVEDIRNFAYDKMGATFPVFSKVDVIGPKALPAWKYLKDRSGVEPTWNFWKFLINHDGQVINAWSPSVSPEQLYQDIQSAVDVAMEGTKQKQKNNNRVKEEF